jgi:hypothetical protein
VANGQELSASRTRNYAADGDRKESIFKTAALFAAWCWRALSRIRDSQTRFSRVFARSSVEPGTTPSVAHEFRTAANPVLMMR